MSRRPFRDITNYYGQDEVDVLRLEAIRLARRRRLRNIAFYWRRSNEPGPVAFRRRYPYARWRFDENGHLEIYANRQWNDYYEITDEFDE